MAHQSLERFGPSFECSWFASVFAQWDFLAGDNQEHFVQNTFTCSGRIFGGMDCVGKLSKCIDGGFEAHSGQIALV